MTPEYQNDEALNALSGEDSLLDTNVSRFSINESEFEVQITLEIQMRPKSQFETITIVLQNVTEYGFYWEKNYSFGLIASYKFFKIDECYYLSLDPDESSKSATDQDQDFVRARSIKVIAKVKT